MLKLNHSSFNVNPSNQKKWVAPSFFAHNREIKDREIHFWELLITESVREKGKSFTVTRQYLANPRKCSIGTISALIAAFEKEGLIFVERTRKRVENGVRTLNTYTINWERALEVFGDKLFFGCSRKTREFCRAHVPCLNQFYCVQNFNTKTDYNNNIYIKFNSLKEEASMTDAVDAVDLDIPPPEPDSEVNPSNRNYKTGAAAFQLESCPPEWRDIAERLGLKKLLVDPEFQEYKQTILGLNVNVHTARLDWDRAWEEHIRTMLEKKNMAFKKVNPNHEFSVLSPNMSFNFKLSTELSDRWRKKLEQTSFHEDQYIVIFQEFRQYYAIGNGSKIQASQPKWDELWEKWLMSARHNNRNYRGKKDQTRKYQNSTIKETSEPVEEIKLTMDENDPFYALRRSILKAIGKDLYVAWIQQCTLKATDNGIFLICPNPFVYSMVKQRCGIDLYNLNIKPVNKGEVLV